jgi:hypothetical protein
MTALLALLLAGLVFYKAAATSFTHDESYTYNNCVTASLSDIFTYKVVSSNNHLINTLLMKAFSTVLGRSEFALRLPNLLAFIGFLIFLFLLICRMNRWAGMAVFALAVCNPYMLDFFALARGNGMSLCFMTGSIYFFSRPAGKSDTRYYALAVLLAFLAVLSHFTLLYYLLALMTVANLRPFFAGPSPGGRAIFNRTIFLRINLTNFFTLLVLGLIIWKPITRLASDNQFFYGGETGFIKNTIASLIEAFLYGKNYGSSLSFIVQAGVFAVTIAAILAAIHALAAKNRPPDEDNRLFFILLLLLIFMTGFNLAHHYLGGTKLLIRRTALLYVPVFMLFTGSLLFFNRKGRLIPISAALATILALAFMIHTLAAFSLTTYLDWDYEKETRHVVDLLQREIPANTPERSVAMGITWFFEPTINFYRDTRALKWLKPVTRDGPAINAEYFYIIKEEFSKIPRDGARPAIQFDDGKVILVRLAQQ